MLGMAATGLVLDLNRRLITPKTGSFPREMMHRRKQKQSVMMENKRSQRDRGRQRQRQLERQTSGGKERQRAKETYEERRV